MSKTGKQQLHQPDDAIRKAAAMPREQRAGKRCIRRRRETGRSRGKEMTDWIRQCRETGREPFA